MWQLFGWKLYRLQRILKSINKKQFIFSIFAVGIVPMSCKSFVGFVNWNQFFSNPQMEILMSTNLKLMETMKVQIYQVQVLVWFVTIILYWLTNIPKLLPLSQLLVSDNFSFIISKNLVIIYKIFCSEKEV